MTHQICNIINLFDQEPVRKKRRSAAEATFEKAMTVYKSTILWHFDDHYQARMKNKDFNDLCSKLTRNGRSVANLDDNEEATTLGENLFLLEAFLTNRQKVIEDIRDDFSGFVIKVLTPAEKKMFDTASEKLIVSIVNSSVGACIDKMVKDKDDWEKNEAAFWYAVTSSASKMHFGFSYVSQQLCREPPALEPQQIF